MKEDKNPESLRERLHGWFLGLQIEKEPLLRCLLMLTQIVFFALLQTTLFTPVSYTHLRAHETD